MSPAINSGDINAHSTELQGLLEKEEFTFVPEEESRGHRLYGYRFVDRVKPKGTVRSRFCVQAFNARAHGVLFLRVLYNDSPFVCYFLLVLYML